MALRDGLMTEIDEYLPAALLHTTSASDTTRDWSSIIGIVVAICGNILISFALNTQRYAHLRLRKDRDERAEKADATCKSKTQQVKDYGTRERSEQGQEGLNGTGRTESEEGEDAHESQPLLSQNVSRRVSDASRSSLGYDEKDGEEQKEKSYLKSPIWWLGIGLMTVGEAGNFLAYGFAPASIVSPLGVVALISNCLIAPLLLHERFRARDGLGVVIAVAGCVTVVLSANDSNPRLDEKKIWHLITRWEFETYLGFTLVAIVALMVVSNKYGHRTIMIDIGLVGLFGGYTALSTKGVASLLSNKIWRVITFPITYLLVAVLIATAVMQIKYLNRALQHFNSTQVIPTQFVMFTLSVIIGSAILYRDFERTTAEQAIKFVGGCALTFLGVWCITSGRRDNEQEHDEDQSDDDGTDVKVVSHNITTSEVSERQPNNAGDKSSSVASTATSSSQSRQVAESARRIDAGVPSLSITPDNSTLAKSLRERPSLPDISEDRPISNAAWNLSDANEAAVHSDAAHIDPSQTLGTSTTGQPTRRNPPQMHATTSEPLLPTLHLSASARPNTPLNRAQSGIPPSPSKAHRNERGAAAPTTPQRDRAAFLDPSTASSASRARHSIVDLLPGPLTSPLSASLSAIVADSLRRGVSSPTSTLKRGASSRRTQIRRQTGGLETPQLSEMGGPVGLSATDTDTRRKRHSIASGDLDLEGQDVVGGRSRSISETIGGLFRNGRTDPDNSGKGSTTPAEREDGRRQQKYI